jgi:hypothetical protein
MMKTLPLNKFLLLSALTGLFSLSAVALEVQQSTTIKPVKATIIAAQKADLIVHAVNSDHAKQDSVRVTIKNIGKLTSDSGILGGQNLSQRGSTGEGTIPAIKPGASYSLDLKFSAPIKKGDQVKVTADAKNHIDESNENNNVKTVSY